MPISSVCNADKKNDLRNAVRSALSSFANNGRVDDVVVVDGASADAAASTIDVYRAMRDVSNLLFEERTVRDALDSDPFGITRRSRIGGYDDDDDDDDDDGDGDDGDGDDDGMTRIGGGMTASGGNEDDGDVGKGKDAGGGGDEEDDEDDDDDEDASEKRKNGRVIARVKVRGPT
jgi:hypothetical protein